MSEAFVRTFVAVITGVTIGMACILIAVSFAALCSPAVMYIPGGSGNAIIERLALGALIVALAFGIAMLRKNRN